MWNLHMPLDKNPAACSLAHLGNQMGSLDPEIFRELDQCSKGLFERF